MTDARRLGAALLAVLIVAASDAPPADESIRQGNAAFEQGDYDAAEALYTRAEEWTTDPGLVAFNKASALYHQGRFREAELHYRRALGDADIPAGRRQRGLYNLGNCLVKEAGEADVGRLRAAIRCYEMCLDEGPADAALRADAAYNLELAKLLWAKARAKSPSPPKPVNEEEKEDEAPPPEPKKDTKDDAGGTGPEPKKDPSARMKLDNGDKEEAKGGPIETKDKPPGAGNLPVLKDEDKLTPLSPEDTRAYLRQAAERLRKERTETRRQVASPENPRANDW